MLYLETCPPVLANHRLEEKAKGLWFLVTEKIDNTFVWFISNKSLGGWVVQKSLKTPLRNIKMAPNYFKYLTSFDPPKKELHNRTDEILDNYSQSSEHLFSYWFRICPISARSIVMLVCVSFRLNLRVLFSTTAFSSFFCVSSERWLCPFFCSLLSQLST